MFGLKFSIPGFPFIKKLVLHQKYKKEAYNALINLCNYSEYDLFHNILIFLKGVKDEINNKIQVSFTFEIDKSLFYCNKFILVFD